MATRGGGDGQGAARVLVEPHRVAFPQVEDHLTMVGGDADRPPPAGSRNPRWPNWWRASPAANSVSAFSSIVARADRSTSRGEQASTRSLPRAQDEPGQAEGPAQLVEGRVERLPRRERRDDPLQGIQVVARAAGGARRSLATGAEGGRDETADRPWRRTRRRRRSSLMVRVRYGSVRKKFRLMAETTAARGRPCVRRIPPR